jgi:acetylornithine/LysW-gamma-L-lysine aminotransferase
VNSTEIRKVEDEHYARFYARKPITIIRGAGVVVYDSEGRAYIDCAGGYGTCIVGHAHPKVVEAISAQSRKLISCHSSAYNDARAELLSKLLTIVPGELTRFFLSNSGSEAVECAIKIARKAKGKRKIVAVRGGYHGKTHGALSATWDAKYRKSFEPLVPDFTHIPFGNAEAAKETVTADTAAILFEPVQGEGGIRVSPPDWLRLLRDLAQETGAVLIADEIQSGSGRTGKMFACQHWDIVPDVLCIGKGIASGLPIGITASNDELMGSLAPGEHTTTFGGNPVVCAASSATIEVLLEEKLVENAARVGGYMKEKLLSLQKEFSIIREIRGLGLMLGAELRFDVLRIIQGALEEGVIVLDAGRNVLRFLPPLCLRETDVDKVVEVLRSLVGKEQIARLPSQITQGHA